jgi:mannan endo-1,4-beta-mannosidase
MPDARRLRAAVARRWNRLLDPIWNLPVPARPLVFGKDAMLRVRAAVVVTAILGLTVVAVVVARPPSSPAATRRPVTPATSGAQVLSYLQSISGRATVAGQHNREPLSRPTRWTDVVHSLTGHYPGLYGADFAFDGEADRPAMVAAAIAQWQAGSLVTLMWHMCPPGEGQVCDFDHDVQSRLTDAQWSQLITDGSPLNRAWKQQIDVVVPLLKQLQAAGVQVLWRPLHESDARWAWWSGRPGPAGSAALFRIMHDYLRSKGLTNLIWVWSVKDVDVAHLADYYPGNRYVDVVGLDSWERPFPTRATYERVLAVAGSKPVALTEVGTLPTPGQLATQPRWTYFMVWAEMLTERNSTAQIRDLYGDHQVLTRDRVALPPASR